ncbi:hypothetical protein [uncultured Acidaminococcus sp.]|jgi:hypothetical protein|nr:hypothetical protein [Acidaminococcus sp. AM05-11]
MSMDMENTTNTAAKKMPGDSWVRVLCRTGLLAVLITISGSIKLPGLVPGTGFQLSAPIAVAICGVFGFKQYITAGLAASLAGFMLGTASLLAVAIQLSFRLGVGATWLLLGSSRLFYVISGPLGTTLARVVIWLLVGKGLSIMLAAAAPGMVYTAGTAWFFAKVLQRCRGLNSSF